MEKGKPDFVELNIGNGANELIRSLSNIETWLEIIARRQTQLLAIQEGKDVEDRMAATINYFNEESRDRYIEKIKGAFPGFRDLPSVEPETPSGSGSPQP